jgi:hypothetical protein
MAETLPVATGKVYGSQDDALQALLPGWHVTGSSVATRKVPNPNRTTTSDPAEIDQPYGRQLTVSNTDGTLTDVIVVNDVQNPSTKGGAGVSVLQGPTKNQPQGSGNKQSDPSKWQPVTRPGTTDVVGTWDPVNNEFHPLAAPSQAPASGKFDPVTVTNPDGSQRQVGMVDTGDKTFHPLASPPTNPSGKFDNVYVSNADGSQRLVGMTDTGDKTFHPLAADPSTNKRTIQTPTAVYSVDDNDKVTKLIDVDKSSPYQAVVIDGVTYRFDPNEKDPTRSLVQVGPDSPMPQTIKDAAGNTMVLTKQDDGTSKYVLPPGVKPASTLNVNTTAKDLVWYDDQGNVVKTQPNTNYVPPKPDQPNLPPTNTVAPNILVPDPDNPGKFKWIPNEARVTASEALQNLASTLSGHVVDNKITVDEAKAIIDGANTTMQTATTAANAALDYTSRGAQTGAGMLQQRAATAQGALSDILRAGTSRPLTAGVPSGIGAGLVQGITDWTAQLMGGQDTLNAAANMVHAAAPGEAGSPTAAAATSALTQMLQKYQQLNGGQPHPIEMAHQAATASAQNGGVAAPLTTPPVAPAPVVAPPQPGVSMTPNMVNMTAMPGFGGGGQSTQMPNFAVQNAQAAGTGVGQAFQAPPVAQVPGQNYGAQTAYTGGTPPWLAQQGFVAPPQPSVTIHVGGG